jgi:hypothetical protein
MSQASLDREVARATGESLDVIRRRGFSIVQPDELQDDDLQDYILPLPGVVDWDDVDAKRVVLFPQATGRRAMAA